MHLPITLTMAAGAMLVHFWLVIRCSGARASQKVSVGDGGNALMVARMRAHSNFTENAPLFLILLGLVEFTGGTQAWLWGVGILFILARISHAFGMERKAPNPFRAGGMMITMLLQLALTVYAILLSYGVTLPHA